MTDAATYEKLAAYCSYQERCATDVARKMQRLKIDKILFAEYLEKLQQHNYLNEDRYVKYFVSAHVKKKWGRTKIKAALTAKKLSSELTKKYLDDIDEQGYDEQLQTIAHKKWNSLKAATANEKKTKMLRFLLSKGYEMGKALNAIKELNKNI
jgi:regulatory protein